MEILIPLAILLFSAILHEVMHGVVADRLGDPTARIMGRLTLNPIPHLDPVTSIIVPTLLYLSSGGTFFFAAAKPVPINPRHFHEPMKDMALTGLAGPLTNFAIAIVAAEILRFVPLSDINQSIIFLVVQINLMLGFVNLIPIPPLDGSRVLAAFLPNDLLRSYMAIERYGIYILFFLFFFPIGGLSLGQLVNNLIIFTLHLLGI
ncbi:MAG TPA: site-2 protease family protein [Patescibacteria group bacterium]|nr:site-2 protease family protein [Patescibacteria group bacterium]